MTAFTYTAINPTGDTVTATQKAKSESVLRDLLASQGLAVRSVVEKKSIWQFEITKTKVPPTELMHFSRQLGAFVKAGIPILDAIDIIAMDAGNKTLRETLLKVSHDIAEGSSFSDAAGRHPNVFPDFYVRTLRSAELTGKLDSVLSQLSTYIERDEDAKRKIQAALIYPAIIVVLAVVVIIILMTYVLPKFKTFFADFNAELPLPTRILLGTGDFLANYWPFLVVGAIGIAVALMLTLRTHAGRRLRDGLILRIPIVGDVIRFAIIERFCRVLSSLTNAAVAIPEALSVATQGTNNLVYEEALQIARTQMMEGRGLSGPITETKLFPRTVTQMIRVGEETGTLDDQLHTAAEFYDVELGYKIKRFTTIIEPTVIVIVGVIVGFVAIALVSAMYGIYHQVDV